MHSIYGCGLGHNALADGTLDTSYFVAGTATTVNGHGQFVFDTVTGPNPQILYWVSDGVDSAPKIAITDLLMANLSVTDLDLR